MESNSFNNPILKEIKNGDIVMVEMPSKLRAAYKQICKLTDIKYEPADKETPFDWLNFKSEILYTNYRLHPTMMHCIGNCLAISEIIPAELIDTYVRQNEMWRPEQYPLSDAEFEQKRNLCIF